MALLRDAKEGAKIVHNDGRSLVISGNKWSVVVYERDGGLELSLLEKNSAKPITLSLPKPG